MCEFYIFSDVLAWKANFFFNPSLQNQLNNIGPSYNILYLILHFSFEYFIHSVSLANMLFKVICP